MIIIMITKSLDRPRVRSCLFLFYSTCRFSQLLDLLSRAQTLPRRFRTLRLALVRLPRYFFGELFSEQEPRGERLRLRRERRLKRSRLRSGFSSFRRIWVSRPTRSSSTLWFMPTDVSMNLQSYDIAIILPSATGVRIAGDLTCG